MGKKKKRESADQRETPLNLEETSCHEFLELQRSEFCQNWSELGR